MKKIMAPVAGVFFSLFGLAVIALLMSYTFEALGYIFPDNFTAQAMGMILFDIASLAWLGAFIYLSKSIMQYAFAFVGFAFGLIGSLAMVAIDVMLGGQKMIDPPAWVNSALVYGFIGAAVVHVVLTYAYKLAAPEVSADISLGIETANITEEAMKQAESHLLSQRGNLAANISPRLMNNVLRNLGLPVSGEVIDAQAYDVNDLTRSTPVHVPRSMTITERLKAAAQVLTNTNPATATPRQYQAVTPAPVPVPTSPTPTAAQANPQPAPVYHPVGMNPDPAPINAEAAITSAQVEEVPQGDFFRAAPSG